MRKFYIPYGEEKAHATALAAGLARMPQNFIAEICFSCKGEGQYEQMYTAGCGGGYYRSRGPCDWCGATGLLQDNKPAPDSVRNQVLEAAKEKQHDVG